MLLLFPFILLQNAYETEAKKQKAGQTTQECGIMTSVVLKSICLLNSPTEPQSVSKHLSLVAH